MVGVALVVAGFLYAAPEQGAGVAAPTASPHRAFLNRYCVTCHSERLRTADLSLEKMDVENVASRASVWEKVVRKLRAGQMPPVGAPRPDRLAYDSFISYLEEDLDRAAETKPNPGSPSVHRLNRAEYANAIRDLLALEIDGEALLPPDSAGSGFDNIADVLSVSPLLMERYMQAARSVSRLAIGDTAIRPAAQSYGAPQLLLQDDRVNEDLPFGSRGGIAVRHHFPLDGEYVIRIRLQRNEDGFVRGAEEAHELDVRLDGARIKLFAVGGERRGTSGPVYSVDLAYYRGDAKQVGYEYTADEGLEVRFPAKAGTRSVGVTFLKKTASAREGVLRPRPMFADMTKNKAGEPAVDSFTIVGPYSAQGPGETPSRRKLFTCQPGDDEAGEPCARQILSKLARSAYRRPVTDEEVRDLLALYRTGQEQGGFEAGIQRALHRILAGPEFLFRAESDPGNVAPNTAYPVSDLDMASRLSFFLWSSIPDDELLDLAERGRLREPAILEQQVRRMLADSRSKALVSNFAGQWLYLRNLRNVSPDPKEFPDFDDNLREAFQQETKLWFESMLREDRSIVDLLNSDYSFVNERLALHYGIPNVYGSHFRRASITDEHRQGLLGQGSVLTVTSYPNRTSPVLRGKWILENLLGTPPPPPPPDVASELKESKEGKPLTMRQQMEQHRANPACASCHKLMDPIGFALENFDAVAKWRTEYRVGEAVAPIDTAGELYDGSKFRDVVELRQLLLSHRGEFVRTVTEKLLTYALGRGVEHYDAPAIRSILREAAPNEYRWSAIILGIVKSVPFQMRRSRES